MDPLRYGQTLYNRRTLCPRLNLIHFQPPRRCLNSKQRTNSVPPNNCKLYKKSLQEWTEIDTTGEIVVKSLTICCPTAPRKSIFLHWFWACLRWLDLPRSKPHPLGLRGVAYYSNSEMGTTFQQRTRSGMWFVHCIEVFHISKSPLLLKVVQLFVGYPQCV